MIGVAAVALTAGQAWAQTTPRVGVVSAVNPAAVGTPPGADTRPIVIGSDVSFREKVVTTGDGQAQLMFLDQSTMMIGPNSQVVIDEFVFDPNTSSGKFAATLTQGSFRYIGGKLSKQGDATLKTPVATIGIRGSDIVINHNDTTNASGIQTIHGNATVQSNGETIKLPTGFGTLVNGPGQSPNHPLALTAANFDAVKAAFEGQPGKNAGATQVPQNADVEKSGLPGAVEARGLANIETAAGPGINRPLIIFQLPPPDKSTAPLQNTPPGVAAPGVATNSTTLPPQIVVLPTGVATFSGQVGGLINGSRIAFGTFTNAYNFTQQSGTFTLSNFDGNNMRGTVSAPNNPQVFTGTLAPISGSTGAASAATLTGLIFPTNIVPAPAGQPAATSGVINLTGNNYNGIAGFTNLTNGSSGSGFEATTNLRRR
jgi:hypothetical protein